MFQAFCACECAQATLCSEWCHMQSAVVRLRWCFLPLCGLVKLSEKRKKCWQQTAIPFLPKSLAWVAHSYSLKVGGEILLPIPEEDGSHALIQRENGDGTGKLIWSFPDKESLLYNFLRRRKDRTVVCFSSYRLNWKVSILDPNRYFFWNLSPELLQYLQTKWEPGDLLKERSEASSDIIRLYISQKWEFLLWESKLSCSDLTWHAVMSLTLATQYCCKNLDPKRTTKGQLVLPALHQLPNLQFQSILSHLIYHKQLQCHQFKVLVKTLTILWYSGKKNQKVISRNKDSCWMMKIWVKKNADGILKAVQRHHCVTHSDDMSKTSF